MEELLWNSKGTSLTKSPYTYKILGNRDVPPQLNVHTLKNKPNSAATILRSKAIGEPLLMLAISVWLALRDAIARIGNYEYLPKLEAPATPEAILNALNGMRARVNSK